MSTRKKPSLKRRQQLVPGEDGLPVLEVRPWAQDKLYFLSYFMAIFNGGMKNRWENRAYIDLLSGPGRCKITDTSKEIDGSPLCALKSETPFTHCFFNDIDLESKGALEARARDFECETYHYNEDCNTAVDQILKDLPSGALSLAFIDPWNWEFTFESLRRLTKARAMDLIITFHVGSIKRNAHKVLKQLNLSIGDSGWRPLYFQSIGRGERKGSRIILDYYENKLKTVAGYKFVDDFVSVRNTVGVPIYHLIYASRHQTGEKFWKEAIAKTRKGQRRLPNF